MAERINKTLNEYARSMRIHSELPKMFWADAINTAAYLLNHGPSVPLDGNLPEEAWNGKKVCLSHLKVFGCISYVHIDSNARSKLNPKSRKCIVIGYGTDEFGYRFWDDQNWKIIRSRDVIFNEKVMYKDMLAAESDNTGIHVEKNKYVELEEIFESDVLRRVQNNPENIVPQVKPSTPATEVRRSLRIPKPTQRYSLSLHYLLLTDGGEQ